MKPRSLLQAVVLLAATTMLPATAGAQTTTQDSRVKLFASDTMELGSGLALSPDGHWLALSIMETPSVASLWVQRVDGGAPQRLTPGGNWDGMPQWGPDGTAIYFNSNRVAPAGDPQNYMMLVPFDAQHGRATGPLRQVRTQPGFARLSPDGRQLAFIDPADRRLLKVVAVDGGEARLVARVPDRSGNLQWSRDGQAIVFATVTVGQTMRSIMRVPVSGGDPVVVASDIPPQFPFVLGPGGESYVASEHPDPRTRTLYVKTASGALLKTINTNRNTRPIQFTPDGRAVILIEHNTIAPTRIVSIDGGAYRNVTNPKDYYDWVAGWTADGSAVFTWTEHNGDPVLARVPVSDSEKSSGPRVFPGTKETELEGFNSRYIFEASRSKGGSPRTLVALDPSSGTRHSITTSAYPTLFPAGPGGTWGVQENLLYFERRGDQVHIKEWSEPRKMRTIRTLPMSIVQRSSIGVHGNLVAWQETKGDNVDIMVAEGTSGAPRRLASMPAGRVSNNEMSFSHDGRFLAVHYVRANDPKDLMAILDVSGATPPRILDTGLSYWYWSRWTPDNASVVVIGGGRGAEANVVRVPLAEGAKPIDVTRDDPSSTWGFELSPDGRWVAYPGEVYRGQTVWKYDLITNRTPD